MKSINAIASDTRADIESLRKERAPGYFKVNLFKSGNTDNASFFSFMVFQDVERLFLALKSSTISSEKSTYQILS
ncbi:hypothetical protein N7530_008279 [Penicillium desertorum]|uniref:Uncharacterized protein n=1 Tax=Penicillium desertorum TaxID=1303715 RepID=A0A9W9WNY1_9EURO|nr:hypothetical protein N7530_008279 [Penicillium desertorum]